MHFYNTSLGVTLHRTGSYLTSYNRFLDPIESSFQKCVHVGGLTTSSRIFLQSHSTFNDYSLPVFHRRELQAVTEDRRHL